MPAWYWIRRFQKLNWINRWFVLTIAFLLMTFLMLQTLLVKCLHLILDIFILFPRWTFCWYRIFVPNYLLYGCLMKILHFHRRYIFALVSVQMCLNQTLMNILCQEIDNVDETISFGKVVVWVNDVPEYKNDVYHSTCPHFFHTWFTYLWWRTNRSHWTHCFLFCQFYLVILLQLRCFKFK